MAASASIWHINGANINNGIETAKAQLSVEMAAKRNIWRLAWLIM
jgi:hypothetical protein